MTMPFVRVARPGNKLGRPASGNAGVWHVKRPEVKACVPMLVTLKLLEGLPSIRRTDEAGVFFSVLAHMRSRHDGLRIVHWTIQTNHLHLIVEGDDDQLVSRAMQGFAIGLAKRLNKLWGRKGTVFLDRYHRRDLTSPRQTYNALRYVFENYAKHAGCKHVICLTAADGSTREFPWVDARFSSALEFEYWRDSHIRARTRPRHERTSTPLTWMLRTGYRCGGPPIPTD